jgi:hypothetical protein
MLRGAVQHGSDLCIVEHARYQQYTTRSSRPRFENLHGIYQEVLTHDRRIRHCGNDVPEMVERSIKPAWFGENGDRSRAATCVISGALRPVDALGGEFTFGRRAILDLGNDVKHPEAQRYDHFVEFSG